MNRVLRYHVGTLAFGAAVLTIVRVIRGVLGYIQKKTSEAGNPLTKCLLCCAQCCLKVSCVRMTECGCVWLRDENSEGGVGWL